MSKTLKICGLLFLLLFLKSTFSYSQVAPATADTVKIIEILEGKSMRQKYIDSLTTIETIAGRVILKQGTTTFYCDSAAINRRLNVLEAFGNIHINQADSIQTYCQYIKYLGNDKMAYLKKNVKLTDKKGILLTQDLEYDLKSGIGKYHNGGKVINATTTLTSKEGTYYADTKDVYFKNDVDLVDPKYKIKADSMLYNMQTQLATFTGPTHIKSKDGDVYTTQGTYDLKTGNALFTSRTIIKDSSNRTLTANNIASDEKTGIVQMQGNSIIKDSANGYIVTGNVIFLNKKNNSFLATQKPVMIIIRDKDSTYIAGDTLFSGVSKKDDNVLASKDTSALKDTSLNDSLKRAVVKLDSTKGERVTKTKIVKINSSDSTVRYFLAFHNTRIFNDSLQSVCDSLYYSERDSVFRLFYHPIIWTNKNQITGDTVYLYTKNKKADRLYVFENAMIINRTTQGLFNQISGKTLNAYFKDGSIDYMRVRGSKAESIYYPQNEDSSYTGMNRAAGDVIDMYFKKQDLNRVIFVNDVVGKMYPMHQIPADVKYLRNFSWLDKRRPKNKLELFE